MMLTIFICASFYSSVFSMIHPCSQTDYERCTKDEECPENWECIDDTPDPINPNRIDGICVGPPDPD